MPEPSELGVNIGREKRSRRWSYERLAAESQVSVATLKRVVNGDQQGMHTATVGRVAEAFGVGVEALMGTAPAAPGMAAAEAVRALRDAVVSPTLLPFAGLTPEAGAARTVAELHAEICAGWAGYWGGTLDMVVQTLPALITEASAAAVQHGAVAAALPLAQVWELAATALVHYGAEDLAGVAADRAVRAAAEGADPTLTATVLGTYSWVMLHQGRFAEAEAVAAAAAQSITPGRRGDTAHNLAAYGNLLMCALAPVVAQGGVPGELVAEARGVAAQLNAKTPVFQTAFGPTTVAMQETYGYAMLRDTGKALSAARAVRLEDLEGISRSRHWLDVAQALVDGGKARKALSLLQASAAFSPEWFGRQGLARALVRTVREELTRPSDALMDLVTLSKVDTREPAVSLVI